MTRHYVISDLHLGMGKVDNGNWHVLEDFRSDAAFKKFLDFLAQERADELIINGDWIEFLQLEPYAYKSGLFSEKGHKLGWTEQNSLDKLANCSAARAHKAFFDDLRSFLADNKKFRLSVMMGNHDPDLFWPRVQAEMRALLGSPSDDQLQFQQTFIRRGTAHIEHGNQYCSPENKFNDPTKLFHRCTSDGLERLEMVWGTVFVMEFFNELEARLPFVDNVKTQLRALWLGMRNGWVNGETAAKFVKFIRGAGIPWSSLVANLSTQSRDPEQLIQEIDDQELSQEIRAIYESNQEFKEQFNQEVASTPDEEWQAINATTQQQPVSIEQLTPRVADGGQTLGFFRDDPEFRGARGLIKGEVKQVIFGHTHAEIDGTDAQAKVSNYFNTGSWVGSIDLSKKENRERLKNIKEDDLKDDSLFELRLRTVVVEVEGDQTTVALQRLQI